MYIRKYSCVFLKLGESTLCIYVAMDLIPILLGSLVGVLVSRSEIEAAID